MDNLNDELKIYRGADFYVTEKLRIRQPSMGEICDFGEEKYLCGMSNLIVTPPDVIYQLTEMGLDFTALSDFETFLLFSRLITHENIKLLFPDIDFSKGQIIKKHKISSIGKQMVAEESVLVLDNDVEINEKSYTIMADYLRRINHVERTWWKTIGTESTKKRLIRSAKEEYLQRKNFPKPFKSVFLPLISSLVNCSDFKKDENSVWDMKLYSFFDSIDRIQAHENSTYLYTGLYNGCVDFNKVKKELNWMREIK